MIPSEVPDGALPISVDPAGFVGETTADGQRLRVSALAANEEGWVAFLSLVGYETSVGAAFARLMKREALGFLPSRPWEGPTSVQVMPGHSYWLWKAEIRGTREKQGVVIARRASIAQGLREPPEYAAPPALRVGETRDPVAEADAILDRLRSGYGGETVAPRFVLGDPSYDAPRAAAFFGCLRGMRVIMIPSLAWVDYAWSAGLELGLVRPLKSLGIAVWRLDGDPHRWNAIFSAGVRAGQLSRVSPTAEDYARLGARR